MRLTILAEKPMACDLLVDARKVAAVIENTAKTEDQGEIEVAVLVFANGKYKATVFDKGRYVQKYWLRASGLSVCKRGDG